MWLAQNNKHTSIYRICVVVPQDSGDIRPQLSLNDNILKYIFNYI